MLPICRHILSSGEQCRSLRLTGQEFCFHNRMYARHRATLHAQRDRALINTEGVTIGYGRPVGFQAARTPDLGMLEDRTSVQMAISTVVNALASDAMDVGRATALLYGLQLASNNCAPHKRDHSEARHPVNEVVTSEDGTMMAPADRVPPDLLQHEESLREWEEMGDDAEEDDEDDDEDKYDEDGFARDAA
ncbi:hypothetical protein [Terriglobus roseus]|uniref:Uncharacterized protein n=1 Tax=Terriglobus roseus TaxID=392734 RepID=A0A1H4LZF4_9BACT|nr:hypothetical protein [Terriglobus roseus]SEB76111.1 hypothetical protein SAMN05443244_1766 [Terriglobus roseus]